MGFGMPEVQIPAGSRRTRRLFRIMNWPWTTIAAVVVVGTVGNRFPSLSEEYMVAGLAASATVAHVAPTLAELAAKAPGGAASAEMRRSVPEAVAASRRALGWALLGFLGVPWLLPHHHRLAWLALLVPASFAGRALWESWWWRVSRRLSRSLEGGA